VAARRDGRRARADQVGVSRPASLDAAIRKGDPTAVQAPRAIPTTDYASLREVFGAVELGGDDEPR
jgi:hypothetical protein